MKKLFFLILFLGINILSYGSNVYFLDGGDGYIHTNGQTFYSNQDGRASVNYWVWADPTRYMISEWGARFKDPDGNWSTWSSLSSGQGLERFVTAGTYEIQGRVWVDYDIATGYTNFWMYTSFTLTFYVVDNNAPVVPQNVNASWFGEHPVIEWNGNTEYDMDSYSIQKRVVGVTGFATVATVSKTTHEWVDTEVTPAGKFDPTYTIEYKVKANDINGNSSSYSPTSSVTGTTDYIWKKPNSLSDAVIKEYKLYSNYPNPFNPSTQIEFQIPEEGFVNLTVFNSLGEEVEVLVNSYLGMGRYVTEFNGRHLSSGLYFYRLQVDNFTSVGKMLLTK